jgi:hypothetical protein
MQGVVVERDGSSVAVGMVYHIHQLQASNTLDERGRVAASIVRQMQSMQLIHYGYFAPGKEPGPYIDPAIIGFDNHAPFVGPWSLPLLFVLGETDARDVIRRIPAGVQIVGGVADDQLLRVPVPPATGYVAYDDVVRLITQNLQPLFTMLVKLRSIGMSDLALHSLPPPTPDEARAAELGYLCPLVTRVKIVWTMNEMFRQFCAQYGLHFVDRWPDFVDGGVAREGYLMADGVHIQNEYMRESVARFYDLTVAARTKRDADTPEPAVLWAQA